MWEGCEPELSVHFPPHADQLSSTDGLTVSINGAANGVEGCLVIDRLQWNWGDGTASASSFPAEHTYPASGSYKVYVTAYAGDGAARLWGVVNVTLPCAVADEVAVTARDIVSDETHEACQTITVGPGVRVFSPAGLTLRARTLIQIGNGVQVDSGASLELAIHPDAGGSNARQVKPLLVSSLW